MWEDESRRKIEIGMKKEDDEKVFELKEIVLVVDEIGGKEKKDSLNRTCLEM